MPGMMDTILNLGLNDEAVEGFAKKTGNPRFAYDSYRRFIQMFSDVVKEVDKAKFEDVLDDIKAEKGVKFDTDLDADDAPNVFRSRQREDEAGKENSGTDPFKLTSLAKIKVRAAKFYKERDGEDHIQRREHHLLHHAFNLRSGLLPCLLHSARHIAARGEGGGAAERGQEQERQRQNHDFFVLQNLNLLNLGTPPLAERHPLLVLNNRCEAEACWGHRRG